MKQGYLLRAILLNRSQVQLKTLDSRKSSHHKCYSQRSDEKNDKIHPIFSQAQGKDQDGKAQRPSYKTDPYPIPFQHPNNLDPLSSSSKTEVKDQSGLKLTSESSLRGYNYKSNIGTYDREAFRARLVYQSRKRGIVEVELLLGSFIKSNDDLKGWTLDQLKEYDQANQPDWDIYYYLTKKIDPPEGSRFKGSKLLVELRNHTSNSNKQIRKMPEL
ncbi:expressed protein [Phakopsora pachyrhizi]|uniref:Expressed protein n=1 Tax=Phakopsora pachyrhizi TaxID=170000 RepID=A0AAV0B473_PHAPC|nr:expressed protein [Phakopsora pachyrhizi]